MATNVNQTSLENDIEFEKLTYKDIKVLTIDPTSEDAAQLDNDLSESFFNSLSTVDAAQIVC